MDSSLICQADGKIDQEYYLSLEYQELRSFNEEGCAENFNHHWCVQWMDNLSSEMNRQTKDISLLIDIILILRLQVIILFISHIQVFKPNYFLNYF